jgi:hypothetical protein
MFSPSCLFVGSDDLNVPICVRCVDMRSAMLSPYDLFTSAGRNLFVAAARHASLREGLACVWHTIFETDTTEKGDGKTQGVGGSAERRNFGSKEGAMRLT